MDKNAIASATVAANSFGREDIRHYVAELQLHMALHARSLVPSLTQPVDSRHKMLQEAQAAAEKLVSRQVF